ncbi:MULTISPECIES: hypothetical protein [Bacillus]|uniref:hypothetical protein n=1 Tax=Bacillus TaxID=1386 RepID=UPI00041ACE19|nr:MULTISPECIES: hypothetical protein [Bacillus]QHZ49041.1 hypothetical protein M654_007935 [Bacillus sp. NSP9.1]WFA07372.1 hypothetical protein P3X63_06605 [Bacillus sp. HSf4]
MKITERFFKVDSEWNVIHLPYRPNGFAVFIFGDRNHFVGEDSSFWLQHHGRHELLTSLRNKGYTLVNSNLFGRHWGSEKAISYAKQLIHYVFKQEILNGKIHLLAEGTGALITDELLRSIPDQIRSAALLNPCLDLQAHHQREKENKFFYKQFMKEIAESYRISEREAADYPFKSISPYHNLVPVHIWQRLNGSPYPYMIHAKTFEERQQKGDYRVGLTLHLFDHPQRLHSAIAQFFKMHEKVL